MSEASKAFLDRLPVEAVQPLLAWGESEAKGWDIPTRWAVDSKLQCFRDNAHGGTLFICDLDSLLSELEDNGDGTAVLRILFGRKLPLPKWMATALEQGWTPPATWNREDYE